jgi:hypothetical protein
LLAASGTDLIGLIDWGRAQAGGLSFLDGCTLLVLARSQVEGIELGPLVLRLLGQIQHPKADCPDHDLLADMAALLGRDGVSLFDAVLMTWLMHVANNLDHEERSRSHFLWRMRNVDLVLYGLFSERRPKCDQTPTR